MWAQGGRINQRPQEDGAVAVTITGGRHATRTDDRHALLTCGECHQQSVAERSDGGLLTDADITTALAAGIPHECDR